MKYRWGRGDEVETGSGVCSFIGVYFTVESLRLWWSYIEVVHIAMALAKVFSSCNICCNSSWCSRITATISASASAILGVSRSQNDECNSCLTIRLRRLVNLMKEILTLNGRASTFTNMFSWSAVRSSELETSRNCLARINCCITAKALIFVESFISNDSINRVWFAVWLSSCLDILSKSSLTGVGATSDAGADVGGADVVGAATLHLKVTSGLTTFGQT